MRYGTLTNKSDNDLAQQQHEVTSVQLAVIRMSAPLDWSA